MGKIIKIYDNTIGLSFKWVDADTALTQIIFRDTGFHLKNNEIEIFIEKVADAKAQKQCKSCSASQDCKSILLQTPSDKVSIAVSEVELNQIEDLLKGTLFQLRLNNYIEELCKN